MKPCVAGMWMHQHEFGKGHCRAGAHSQYLAQGHVGHANRGHETQTPRGGSLPIVMLSGERISGQ